MLQNQLEQNSILDSDIRQRTLSVASIKYEIAKHKKGLELLTIEVDCDAKEELLSQLTNIIKQTEKSLFKENILLAALVALRSEGYDI